MTDDLAAFLDVVDVKRLRRVPGEAPLDQRERDVVFDAADALDVLVGMVRAVLSLPERLEARAAAEAISVTLGYNDLGRSAGLSEAAEIVRAALALPPSPTAEGTP